MNLPFANTSWNDLLLVSPWKPLFTQISVLSSRILESFLTSSGVRPYPSDMFSTTSAVRRDSFPTLLRTSFCVWFSGTAPGGGGSAGGFGGFGGGGTLGLGLFFGLNLTFRTSTISSSSLFIPVPWFGAKKAANTSANPSSSFLTAAYLVTFSSHQNDDFESQNAFHFRRKATGPWS